MTPPPSPPRPPFDWPTVALAALTAAAVVGCALLVVPFLPGVTWAVALAVVALPLHRWLGRWVKNRSLAAAVSTTLVVLVIGVPVALVGWQLAGETVKAAEVVEKETANDGWRAHAAKVPWVGESLSKVDAAELQARAREWLNRLAGSGLVVVKGVAEFVLQSLVAVFVLFFALRDYRSLLDQTRRLLPLPPPAAERVFGRAADAVHATVYGTFVTAAVQGISGGLLFYLFGLPGALLWGVVMTVLGVLPFVGAFLVWVPAAAYLGANGQWWQAAVLVAWGLLMAGPVSNYLYAVTAGDRLKLHPVPTLLSFIGGLALFGVSGMILGPCLWAVTVALLDGWRDRTGDSPPLIAT